MAERSRSESARSRDAARHGEALRRRATNGRDDPSFPRLGPEDTFPFPDPRGADEQGVLCSGGNLSPGLLLSAYRQGIFPWFSEEDPILWWSPDPRFALLPEKLHVSGTMKKILKRRAWAASLDRDFPAVIRACSSLPRTGQSGTWITEDMIAAYTALHELGYAHSAEVRLEGRLVGGLYGVSLGSAFFGESMFSLEDDASKAAFIPLVLFLREQGFTLIDSQVYTRHLAGLGAEEMPREEYLGLLDAALDAPTRRGNWGELFPAYPSSTEYRRLVPQATPS